MILATVLGLLAGCGGRSPVPASGQATGAQVSQNGGAAGVPLRKVKLASGDMGSFVFLPALVAVEQGYFRELGLDLEITEFKGGAQVAQALAGGEVEFGNTVTDHPPKYKTQGVDMSVVALFTRLPGSALLVSTEHAGTIKSVKDLKGKNVGVTSPNSGSYQSLMAILDKSGMQVGEVEIKGVGFDTGKAFKDGSVVAGVTYEPYLTQILESGTGKVLEYDLRTVADTRKLYGSDYPFGALITRKSTIRDNPDVVARMVRAIVRANKYIAEHSAAEIAKGIPDKYKGDVPAVYVKALDAIKSSISPDGLVTQEGMATVIATLEKQGAWTGKQNIRPDDVVDMSFVQKALAG